MKKKVVMTIINTAAVSMATTVMKMAIITLQSQFLN